MLLEFKTYVWECDRCKCKSEPVSGISFIPPTAIPEGWETIINPNKPEDQTEDTLLCPRCIYP